jgi:hypothetical protein
MVCRCCGGIDDRGSEDLARFTTGRAVDDVDVRLYVGRAVDALEVLSNLEATALRLFVLGAKGRGDFVGDSGVSVFCGVADEARVFIHERSSVVLGLNGLECKREGEREGDAAKVECVDCFRGEPCGVEARTVDGDCARGDSGRLKGDMRPLLSLRPNDSGAGLSGLGGFDCKYHISMNDVRRLTLISYHCYSRALGRVCNSGCNYAK